MHTLKVQLGLTLSILLFVSMFLFGFVMLLLWHHNGIQQEAQISEKLLHIAAASLGPGKLNGDHPAFPDEITNYFRESGILCLQWQGTPSSTLKSQGSCPPGLSLDLILEDAAASGQTKTTYSGLSWNGFFLSKRYVLMATPLLLGRPNRGAIALIRSLDDVSASIRNAQKVFFAYLIINVLIFTTIGFTRLVHLVIKPIERLARLADSRTDIDESSFLSGDGLGEFSQLSISLNRLFTRIDGDKQELRRTVKSLKNANDTLQKNRDEMIRAEKLASIGRLSAGLAHEIGNPLGIIQGYIDLLTESSLDQGDREAFSRRATQELDRINSLIRNLLDLSRSPLPSAVDTIDLHPLLEDLIRTIRIRKTALSIQYTCDFAATRSKVFMDSDGLRQVFLNCILNSLDAIEEVKGTGQGHITLSTRDSASQQGTESILITISDNGIGIDPAHRDAIFDPFFTTKEVGKGTGLGLAVTHNLIKKAGGSIKISPDCPRGTTIAILLPLSTQTKRVSQKQGPSA